MTCRQHYPEVFFNKAERNEIGMGYGRDINERVLLYLPTTCYKNIVQYANSFMLIYEYTMYANCKDSHISDHIYSTAT